jgi:hypothetical protein
MADGVDAMLNATQQPARNSVPDRPAPHSEAQELCATDNSVLRLREVSDATVERTRGTLCMPDMRNVPLTKHGVDRDRAQRAGGAQKSPKAHEKRLQPAGTASGFDPLK